MYFFEFIYDLKIAFSENPGARLSVRAHTPVKPELIFCKSLSITACTGAQQGMPVQPQSPKVRMQEVHNF